MKRSEPITHPIRGQYRRRYGRAWWLAVHRQLALVFGLFFVLLGLTGSTNIYLESLDRTLNPALQIRAPEGQVMLQPDAWLHALKQAQPRRFGRWRIDYPRTPNDAVTAWFEQPLETQGEWYAPLMVSINPYTAEVISSRLWGSTLMTWLFNGHSQLWMNATGSRIVGLLGVVFSLALLSGLWLWRPRRLLNPSAYTLKPGAGERRRLFDIHRLLGFYSSAILLLISLTGTYLAYPELLGLIEDNVSQRHGTYNQTVTSTARPVNPINLAQAVLLARGLFPRSKVVSITPPERMEDTYRVDFEQLGPAAIPATVWVDQYSGQIREVHNASHDGPGQHLADLLHNLHTGSYFGATGRFIWFLTGVIPLLLYGTGLLHWLHKRGLRLPYGKIRRQFAPLLALWLRSIELSLKVCRQSVFPLILRIFLHVRAMIKTHRHKP